MAIISNNPTMIFPMPNGNVNVSALFENDIPTYNCNVILGTGSGRYKVGDIVTISTDDLSHTYYWAGWQMTPQEISFDNMQLTTSFIMPDRDVEVLANWMR